jgi:ComF family protein
MSLIDRIDALLFPPKCVLCSRILDRNELDLCRNCRGNAPECSAKGTKLPFVDSWLALWHYEGTVRRSLLRYKFYGKRHYARSYGRLLAMKLLREREGVYDIVTWVPISRWRKLRRGYDQVELLAQGVCAELGIAPVQCLKKIRHNRAQSRIVGQAHRRANVLGVYDVVEKERFQGKRVLLLDDIITTGATVGECARVLLTAGAKEVHCAAVAAANHHKKGEKV